MSYYRKPRLTLRCQVPLCLGTAVAELVQLDAGKLRVCVKHEFLNLKLYLANKEARNAK